MDWITTSGSSIDEAKSNALDQLGIVADEAEFDIVNDVEKGFLGRIKVEAKVRARVRPKAPAAKDDRRRRDGSKGGKSRDAGGGGRSRGRRGGGGSAQGDTRSKSEARPQKAKPKSNGGQGRSRGQGGNGKGRSDAAAKDSGGRQQKQSRSGQSGQTTENRQDSGTTPEGRIDKSRESTPRRNDVEHEFSREEQEAAALRFLSGLTELLEMEATVAVSEDEAEDGAIELAVNGSELGLLVGPKGSTLNALQELTRTVVQRESQGARTERLRVDVSGYRERRTAALQDFARGVADDVLDSGAEKILEPMGPADRKVVHDTINEIDGVETGSEGEEPRRRVVIRPSG